jgi:hypothetical protein
MIKETSKKRKPLSHRTRIAILFLIAVFSISIALVFLFPGFEASSDVIPSGGLGVSIPGSGGINDFFQYVTAIVAFCTNILGPVLAVAMIIFGGYRYIFSAGDSTALTEGKDIILGAIIGYAMLFLTKLIMNIIGV